MQAKAVLKNIQPIMRALGSTSMRALGSTSMRALGSTSMRAMGSTVFFAFLLLPNFAQAARSYAPHEGYLDSVENEHNQTYKELDAIANPDTRVSLRDRIFDEKLMKEFRERYEERFGRTEAVRAYFAPNQFTYYDDVYGFKGTVQDDNSAKQSYANYMVRRLVEYHAEKYFKSDPGLKKVWDVKEAVSQAQAGGKNFKVKGKYNLSSNLVDLEIQNPLVTTKLTTRPDGKGSQDNSLVLARNITPTIGVEARYKFEGTVYLIGSKRISEALGTNITFAQSAKNNTLLTSYRENLAIAGLTYNY